VPVGVGSVAHSSLEQTVCLCSVGDCVGSKKREPMEDLNSVVEVVAVNGHVQPSGAVLYYGLASEDDLGNPMGIEQSDQLKQGPGEPDWRHLTCPLNGQPPRRGDSFAVLVRQDVRGELGQPATLIGEALPVTGTGQVGATVQDVRRGLSKGKG
jgi:hypothetical protein